MMRLESSVNLKFFHKSLNKLQAFSTISSKQLNAES